MYLVSLNTINEFNCPWLQSGFAGMKQYLELTGIKTYNSNGDENSGQIEKSHFINLEDFKSINLLKDVTEASARYPYQNSDGGAFENTWHDWIPQYDKNGFSHGYFKCSGICDESGTPLIFTLPGTTPGFKEQDSLDIYKNSIYYNNLVRYDASSTKYCKINRDSESISIEYYYNGNVQETIEILKNKFDEGVVPLFVLLTMVADGGSGGKNKFVNSGSGGGGGGTITAILNLTSGPLYFWQLSDWHTYLSNNPVLNTSDSSYGYVRVNRGEDGKTGAFGTEGGLGGECQYSGSYNKFLMKLSDTRLADKTSGKGGKLLKASDYTGNSYPDGTYGYENINVFCCTNATSISPVPEHLDNNKILRVYDSKKGLYNNFTKDGGVGGASAISSGGNNAGGSGQLGGGGGGYYVGDINKYNGGYGIIYLQY